MPLFLGVDLGTSYFKVGLFDEHGELKGLGRISVGKSVPAPGRCELAPDNFWRFLRQGLKEALAAAAATPADICGISYSSQASSFVLLDRKGSELTPLILWTDSRGEPVEERLVTFSNAPDFRATVGFEGITGQFAVAKWAWFRDHQPELWNRAGYIMTMSDYFCYSLTGERAGDESTVGFLGLYDLLRRRWWEVALKTFGIDAGKLSIPQRTGSPCGRTTARAGGLLGLPVGIPFSVGGLDHHVAAVGSGLGRFADMSISTGTVLAALALVDQPLPRSECYHGVHVDGERYSCLAFDPKGAGQLEDYERHFKTGLTVGELIALAEASGGSPPSPLREGAVRSKTEHGAAVRILLEQVAATHRRLVKKVSTAAPIGGVVATGGGARSPFWLQMKADMLGVPVIASASAERACLGAAMFAAVAAGTYASIEEASLSMVRIGRTFVPDAHKVNLYREWVAPA